VCKEAVQVVYVNCGGSVGNVGVQVWEIWRWYLGGMWFECRWGCK
jgi:hypothetical protein